jgi:hypothetical protein
MHSVDRKQNFNANLVVLALKAHERVPEIERGNSSSLCLENSLWKRPWICRKTEYGVTEYTWWYEAYSEMRIFPPQHWGRDFTHALSLPSFTGKPYTPIRERQIVFTYCSVRLQFLRWSNAPPTVKYGLLSVFWMQEIWNRPIFIVRYVKYTVKMPWVIEWQGNGLESLTKVVITCMKSRAAAGRLSYFRNMPRI